MASSINNMLDSFQIPEVCALEVSFDRTRLNDLETKLEKLWNEKQILIHKGDRIAITGGSRGVAEYQRIMRKTVSLVKQSGGIPFIVPAMGSHGGATAEGQRGVLEKLGITQEAVGAPIISSMEVEEVGKTELGHPVYIDKHALSADGIILLNRVKSHTSIREKYQSGLMKMLAIGLAKHIGAAATHSLGVPYLGPNMVRVAKVAFEKLNIIAGISIIENGYEELADIYVSRKNDILTTEPEILKRAISMIPSIPVPAIDVLIVFELGKDISGTGMDPAVIGRPINRGPHEGPHVEVLGLLRLTEKSSGNASGCGMADFITRKLKESIDEESTIVNSLTGMHPEIARIPAALQNDELIFKACMKAAGLFAQQNPRLVIIKNTKALNTIYLSRAAYESIPDKSRVKIISDFHPVSFDTEGNLEVQWSIS
ncbi:DUF362 domain-containing protein [Sphaerochaeta sp. S2]|uniref:DUF362 domain-containing protein n=1 Tax=Sphaerochaeta sp. S2 TaxID=2798868 RepID=UPI0018E97F21|nr:DUF362 domain-containing protein [Sphaerochaeta sp. S2]MBJ2357674.1 DUF362 domain-containing protein [Sphaerochaeta sp. S2]